MKILLSLLLLGSLAMGMTEEEILAMNKKAHDEVELMEELQIFPYSREMVTELKVKFPKEEDGGVLDAKTKFIQGEYIVYESKMVNEMVSIRWVNVITYSRELKRYKMWGFSHIEVKDREEPIKRVREFDGIYIEGTKFLTWTQVPQPGDELHVVMASHLDPDGERFTVHEYADGKLISIVEGKDSHLK